MKLYHASHLKRIFSFLVVLAGAQIDVSGQTSPSNNARLDPKMVEALTKFGLAHVDLFKLVAKEASGKSLDVSNDDISRDLRRIADTYKTSNEGGRVGVGLLDTSFEVALVGTDVATAGSSLLVTAPLRWVKKEAMDGLYNNLQQQQLSRLKREVRSIESKTGLTYDALRKRSPDEISHALDKIGYFSDLERDLHGDPDAQALARESAIRALIATDKATLAKVSETQFKVAAISKAVASYVRDTSKALTNLQGRIDDTNATLTQTQRAVEVLTEQTKTNTQQLRVIGDLMYGKATAAERATMLRGGYLKDVVPDEYRKNLLAAADAEASRDRIVGEVQSTLRDVAAIGTIARNLGVNSPSLNAAIDMAGAATNVIANAAAGNYLGAVAGLTGMFNPQPDPNAERQAQLMSFLTQQFQQVNKKLDDLLVGQQKIMQGLSLLSQQMAAYNQTLNERLNRIQYNLATIEAIGRQTFYFPLVQCGVTKENILRDFASRSLPLSDPTTLEQQKSAAASAFYSSDIMPCVNYLQALYRVGLDPSAYTPNVTFQPLALRLANSMRQGSTPVPDDVAKQIVSPELLKNYEDASNVERFYNFQYVPTISFVTSALEARNITPSVAMTLLVAPSPSVFQFREKLTKVTPTDGSCVTVTHLSIPLVGLLCRAAGDPIPPTPATLLPTPNAEKEQEANMRAANLLRMALMHDSLQTLGEWSMFFAPLYDLGDTATNTWVTEPQRLLTSETVQPRGPRLLEGAAAALSVGVAQANALYGDLVSFLVYDQLFDVPRAQFPTQTGTFGPVQQKALLLLSSENDYLRRNVLMFGLIASGGRPANGAFAYRHALQYLKEASVNADAQLRSIFGEGWRFGKAWRPTMSSDVVGYTEKARECATNAMETKECQSVPVARVFGLEIDMPSPDALEGGALVYPQIVSALSVTRARVTGRLVDYGVLNASEDDPAARQRLVRAIVAAIR